MYICMCVFGSCCVLFRWRSCSSFLSWSDVHDGHAAQDGEGRRDPEGDHDRHRPGHVRRGCSGAGEGGSASKQSWLTHVPRICRESSLENCVNSRQFVHDKSYRERLSQFCFSRIKNLPSNFAQLFSKNMPRNVSRGTRFLQLFVQIRSTYVKKKIRTKTTKSLSKPLAETRRTQ